jgi:hydroxypyruvate reductase
VVSLIAEALQRDPGTIHLWGGEVTVVLPGEPGRGGRNQQLALYLAEIFDGETAAVALCAGTDGSDGPTADAGSLVDSLTADRGRTEGLVLADHLRRADAGSFLEQTGDLISTGPTGTNVTDLVIAWHA